MPKVVLGATIPVAPYANLQPVFEAESDSHDDALEIVLGRMKELWDRTAEAPLSIDKNKPETDSPKGELKRCWASGTEVFFDPVEHIYRDAKGNKYLGGSSFAHRYGSDFPAEKISGAMARKNNVDAGDILAMWDLNSNASTTVGTAVHAALELRQKYGALSQAVKQGSLESALTKNPILRPLVDAFYTEERAAENALAEVFVADARRWHAGLIDRLVILDSGNLRIEDYKTSTDVLKPETIKAPFKDVVPANQLGLFTIQLNFYRRILEAHGKIVEGLRVWHWTGEQWDAHDLELLDLDAIVSGAS